MIVKENSWHLKLLKEYNTKWYQEAKHGWSDSCEYIRRVLVALVVSIILTIVLSAILGSIVGDCIAWVCAMFSMWQFIPPNEPVIVIFVIATSLVLTRMLISFSEWNANRKANICVAEKEPGFISQAYDHLKNKYCSKVIVVVKGNE